MMAWRCIALRRPFAAASSAAVRTAAGVGNAVSQRPSTGKTLGTLPLPAPASLVDSRTREVEAACAALAESIDAGDCRWFERVVGQLREVLAERREEVAEALDESGPGVGAAVGPSQGDAADAKILRKEHAQQDTDFRGAAIGEEQDAMAPAWLRALRLVEAAMFPEAAPTPHSGLPHGTAPQFDEQKDTDRYQMPNDRPQNDLADAGVAEYLASFERGMATEETTGGSATGRKEAALGPQGGDEEPPWLRALRLLEAADLPGGNDSSIRGDYAPDAGSDVTNCTEDPRMGRYDQLLGGAKAGATPQEDARRGIRMQRYEEMLREVDQAGQSVAPGASVPPLRYEPRETSSSPPTPLPPPPPPLPQFSDQIVDGMKDSDSVLKSRRRVKASETDPFAQAVGRGNLVRGLPGPGENEEREEGELRKEDFVWSEHEFNDGEKENKRVLRRFLSEFKRMAAETEDGLRNPRLLTAALDIALACVKCYELDKADSIYRRVVGECRRRGLPWDVKCLQDMATLRCKQHRQADAAELLEELANKAPPHPATFINLGTVYNQLRQYEKAETWFRQAVNLKGGTPGREDLWNLGIAKKNMQQYDEALPMLEEALAEFQEHEPHHPVTIAKLHSSVAGCLHEAGQPGPAIEHYQQAHKLYVDTVGTRSPLFCGAAEGLAKALKAENRFEEAFPHMLEAFEVHAKGDAVHPTPLFEHLDLALELHNKCSNVPLDRLAPLIDAAVENLDRRGLVEDGNAGLVMSRGGKVLSRLGSAYVGRACELLHRGAGLIRQSHEAGDADLSHEVFEAEALLGRLERSVREGDGPTPTPFSSQHSALQ